MCIPWSWASVVLLSACAAESLAQTYTIKLKTSPDTGMSVTVRQMEKESGGVKFFDSDGKLIDEVKPVSREIVYTLTILAREKGDAATRRYKRTYEKAMQTEENKSRALSYQGRTVVFERKGGTCRVGVVGKPPLDSKDLDELIEKANDGTASQADMDRLITPTKAVAVGEHWTIDPKALASLLKDYDLDLNAIWAEAKLVKVYTKGKSQFGVIEINMKLAVKVLGQIIKFDPPATRELKLIIDTAIDGSSTAGKLTVIDKLKGKGVVQNSEKKVTVVIDGETSAWQDCSEEKDDAQARNVPAVEFVGPDGSWIEFASKEGRFSATFPGKPVVETKKDAKGKVTTSYTVTREQGPILYMVVYIDDLPDDPKIDPKVLLKGLTALFAKDTKEKKEIKLNGYDGIELVRDTEQDGTKLAITCQIIDVNGRLYQVMVVSAIDAKEKVEVRKFLDSFQLHETKGEKKPKEAGKK